MHILYITYGCPYPPNGGAKARDFNLLLHLSRHHQVTCVCLLEPNDEAVNSVLLENFGVKAVSFHQNTRFFPRLKTVAYHLLKGLPIATVDFFNRQMFLFLKNFTKNEVVDFVQVEHSFLAPYLLALPERLRSSSLIDLHNIGELQYSRMADLPHAPEPRLISRLKAVLMRNWEVRFVTSFAGVSVVSENEAQWLRSRNPALCVSVIENGVDANVYSMLPEEPELDVVLFVGTMGYSPNVDAVRWFCLSIWPLIRQSFPDLQFLIVGRNPSPEVKALEHYPGVMVSGCVDDLQPYYRKACLVVVPLRAGGGTRLKILEAMAFGRTVVSTSIGCEGLTVKHGEHLLIADDPVQFADCIMKLLNDARLRLWIANNGRSFVAEHHNWETIGNKLLNTIAELAHNKHVA